MENGIKRIRLCMGLTQQQFADMLECSQGNIGHYELRDQMVPPEMARKLIAEAAKRGSRVTYEDIYGAVDEPVVVARFKITRVARELNERKKRHAED
jgi:putative transcriptional regulator